MSGVLSGCVFTFGKTVPFSDKNDLTRSVKKRGGQVSAFVNEKTTHYVAVEWEDKIATLLSSVLTVHIKFVLDAITYEDLPDAESYPVLPPDSSSKSESDSSAASSISEPATSTFSYSKRSSFAPNAKQDHIGKAKSQREELDSSVAELFDGPFSDSPDETPKKSAVSSSRASSSSSSFSSFSSRITENEPRALSSSEQYKLQREQEKEQRRLEKEKRQQELQQKKEQAKEEQRLRKEELQRERDLRKQELLANRLQSAAATEADSSATVAFESFSSYSTSVFGDYQSPFEEDGFSSSFSSSSTFTSSFLDTSYTSSFSSFSTEYPASDSFADYESANASFSLLDYSDSSSSSTSSSSASSSVLSSSDADSISKNESSFWPNCWDGTNNSLIDPPEPSNDSNVDSEANWWDELRQRQEAKALQLKRQLENQRRREIREAKEREKQQKQQEKLEAKQRKKEQVRQKLLANQEQQQRQHMAALLARHQKKQQNKTEDSNASDSDEEKEESRHGPEKNGEGGGEVEGEAEKESWEAIQAQRRADWERMKEERKAQRKEARDRFRNERSRILAEEAEERGKKLFVGKISFKDLQENPPPTPSSSSSSFTPTSRTTTVASAGSSSRGSSSRGGAGARGRGSARGKAPSSSSSSSHQVPTPAPAPLPPARKFSAMERQSMQEQRKELLLGVFRSYGHVTRVKPYWDEEHLFVVFDSELVAERCVQDLQDFARRQEICQRLAANLRATGQAPEAAPLPGFYVRWPSRTNRSVLKPPKAQTPKETQPLPAATPLPKQSQQKQQQQQEPQRGSVSGMKKPMVRSVPGAIVGVLDQGSSSSSSSSSSFSMVTNRRERRAGLEGQQKRPEPAPVRGTGRSRGGEAGRGKGGAAARPTSALHQRKEGGKRAASCPVQPKEEQNKFALLAEEEYAIGVFG